MADENYVADNLIGTGSRSLPARMAAVEGCLLYGPDNAMYFPDIDLRKSSVFVYDEDGLPSIQSIADFEEAVAGDLQIEITALQTAVVTINGQISTLQTGVSTLDGQVATLQADVSLKANKANETMTNLTVNGTANGGGAGFSVAGQAGYATNFGPSAFSRGGTLAAAGQVRDMVQTRVPLAESWSTAPVSDTDWQEFNVYPSRGSLNLDTFLFGRYSANGEVDGKPRYILKGSDPSFPVGQVFWNGSTSKWNASTITGRIWEKFSVGGSELLNDGGVWSPVSPTTVNGCNIELYFHYPQPGQAFLSEDEPNVVGVWTPDGELERLPVLGDGKIDPSLLTPNFGPLNDPNMQDMFRVFQGLSSGYERFFVASSHIDNGPPDERPTMAVSKDGVEFTTIGVSYDPPSGDGTRDCSIFFHRNKFYLAYTAGNFGVVQYFGIAVSDGTLNDSGELVFTHLTNVTATTADTLWAPEWFTDLDGNIYIGFTTPTGTSPAWEVWYVRATSDDLTTWTSAAKIGGVNTGSAKIDMDVISWDGKYLLVTRNYSGNGAFLFESNSPVSGYSLKTTINYGSTMEGQNLVNVGNGILRLYYIANPGGGGVMSYRDSTDGGLTFGAEFPITGDFPVPHMTVIPFLDPSIAAARTITDVDIPTAVMAALNITEPKSYLVPANSGSNRTTNIDFAQADIPIVISTDLRILRMTIWATEPAVIIRKVYIMKIAKSGATDFYIERVSLTENVDVGPDYYDYDIKCSTGGDIVNGAAIGKLRLEVVNKIQDGGGPNWQVQVQFEVLRRPLP